MVYCGLVSFVTMNTQKHICLLHFLFFSLLSGNQQVLGRNWNQVEGMKLFVFGDSYADTGNTQMPNSSSWRFPYGITFPGKPTGRFSDGLLSTDFIARSLGVKPPTPYSLRGAAHKNFNTGMNFAYAGTGVFDTFVQGPNMSVQIDQLQHLIDHANADLQNSVAYVTAGGNDYYTYIVKNGSAKGWPSHIKQVVDQLVIDLRRIHDMGVSKIIVTNLEPIGCVPVSTMASSFTQCNQTENSFVDHHNALFAQSIANLNKETKASPFVLLNVNHAFMSILNTKGSRKFENLLKPCCVGTGTRSLCGDVDEKGLKLYTVCNDPKSFFFWDIAHPSQEGWRVLYSLLSPSLRKLRHCLIQ